MVGYNHITLLVACRRGQHQQQRKNYCDTFYNSIYCFAILILHPYCFVLSKVSVYVLPA